MTVIRGSHYVDSTSLDSSRTSKGLDFRKIFTSLLSILLGAAIVFSSFPMVAAYADGEDDSKKVIQDSYKESGAKSGNEGLQEAIDKSREVNGRKGDRDNTFFGLLDRIFSIGYINYTPDSYPEAIMNSSGVPNSEGYNCNPDDPRNGTLAYHNCDIPNFMTEVVQTIVSEINPSSRPTSAMNQIVKMRTPLRAFGLPSTLPEEGVPSNPDERNSKFTGLELYGYGLQYTSYSGEWDNVKTLTTARLMTNFGLMDGFAVAGNTIYSSIKSGAEEGAERFSESLSKGDVIGAAFGFVTGYYEGAVSGGIHSIVDTSERNIFEVDGWYRPGFAQTLYNGRELTDAEIAFASQKGLLGWISENPSPGASDMNAAIEKGKTLLEPHTPYKMGGGGADGPGPQGIDCSGFVLFSLSAMGVTDFPRTAQKQFDALAGNDVAVEDIQPGDLLFFAGARRGRPGSVDGITHVAMYMGDGKIIESNRGTSQPDGVQINNFNPNKKSFIGIRRVPASMMDPSKVKEASVENRADQIAKYIGGMFSNGGGSAEWSKPYKKYICYTSGGDEVQAYSANGKLDESCAGELRPPIQGGLFGSGYDNTSYVDETPEDTRRTVAMSSFMGLGLESQATTYVANGFLFMATIITQISNMFLNFSFSPPLASIGLNEIIISAIEGFRESIFFPLSSLMVTIAALMFFYNAGVKRKFREQMTSLFLIILTFLSGTVLMMMPDRTVNAVDKIPSMVEATIVGGIYNFSTTEGDQLCTATGGSDNKGGGGSSLDLSGVSQSTVQYTRTLMCENWRAFAFNPWVEGQWGTSYSNLYANGHGVQGGGSFKNSNESLVGSAAVNMGGDVVVNNWALYQLDVTSLGTTTDFGFKTDKKYSSGSLNPDFYRLVDLQAGPNGGEKSDGRYLKDWSGLDGSNRIFVAFLSMIVAGFAAVTVIVYSFAKIAISLSLTLLVVILPLMFTLALLPIFRRTLKGYFGTIISLMIQRVFYVLLLAVLFVIVIGLQSNVNMNYFVSSVSSIVFCILLLMYREEVMGLIQKETDATMGAFSAGLIAKPFESIKNSGIVSRTSERGAVKTRAAVATTFANVKNNGLSAFNRENRQKAKDFYRQESGQSLGILKRRQLYRGVPGLMVAQEAGEAADRKLNRKYSGKRFEGANRALADEYNRGKPQKVVRGENSAEMGSEVQHVMGDVDRDKLNNPDVGGEVRRRGARLTEAANRDSGDISDWRLRGSEEKSVRHNRGVVDLYRRRTKKIDRRIKSAEREFDRGVQKALKNNGFRDQKDLNTSKDVNRVKQYYKELAILEKNRKRKLDPLKRKKDSVMRSILENKRLGRKAVSSTNRYQRNLSSHIQRKAEAEDRVRTRQRAKTARRDAQRSAGTNNEPEDKRREGTEI